MSSEQAVLHHRWLTIGKITVCGLASGEVATKASAVTCPDCRVTLPWAFAALTEPFAELAAAYGRMIEAIAPRPKPWPADGILRSVLQPLDVKPFTLVKPIRPLVPTQLWDPVNLPEQVRAALAAAAEREQKP